MRLALASLVLTGCGLCGTSPGPSNEPPPPRTLGTVELGWHEAVFTARLEEGQSPGKTGRRARIAIRHAAKVRSGEHEQPMVDLWHPSVRLPAVPLEWFTDSATARRTFAALTLDHCKRGNEIVFRVHEPTGTYRPYEPEDWEVLYFPDDDRVVHSTFRHAAATCADAAAAAPTLEDVLRTAVNAGRDEACRFFLATQNHAESIRCVIRGGAYDDAMNALVLAISTGVAEDALYQALDANSTAVPDSGDSERIARLFEAARDPAKKRRWIESAIEQCRASPTPCPAHRARAMGIAAAQLADGALCDRVVDLGSDLLSRPPDGPGRALQLFIGAQGCGTETRWKEVLRRALGERSVPPAEVRRRGSEDPFVYSQCRPEVSRLDDRVANSCLSLPRWSAWWLSQHCDAPTLARANELLATFGPNPDRTHDDLADAALRVREACAPSP